MKRFLLPLLAALALPAAVDAFPFGNDLEIKNNVGEKTLIKGKTVSIEKFYKSDLLGLIDNNISRLEKSRSEHQGRIDYWQKKFIEAKEYAIKTCNEKPYSAFCPEAKDPEKIFSKSVLDQYVSELPQYDSRITNKLNFKAKVVKDKSFENIVHFASVSFTPVYIDLNNTKEVGKDEMIYCFNSKLDKTYKRYWQNESSISDEEFFKNGLLLDKVCEKYAKF